MSNEKTKASEEQIAYAKVLNVGMWFGLALLIITFFVYVSGVLPTHVPINDLPKYWTMRVHDFNVALNAPTGWHWTALVGKGDYLNFVGIAILSGLTILCYLVILPILIRKKDTPYVLIAIVEVLVLALAASGIMKVGGH
jgi:putative copper export protein